MHVYVINLMTSHDRREYIVSQLARARVTDYRIVPGTDGRSVDPNDAGIVDQDVRAVTGDWLRGGAVACALSHLAVYRQVLKDGADYAVVLEDDAVLPSDFQGIAREISSTIGSADVALLYYSRQHERRPCELSAFGAKSLDPSRTLALPIDINQPAGGVAYVISRECCSRMLDHFPPIQATADAWGFFQHLGIIHRLWCVSPALVGVAPFRSTIGYTGYFTLKGELLSWIDSRRVFPFYQLARFRRQRKLMGRGQAIVVSEEPRWQ